MELQRCHGGKFLIIFLPSFSLSRSLKFVSIDAGMRTPTSQRTLIIPFQLVSLNDPFCSIFQKIISHHLFCHQSANKAVSSTPSSDHIMRSLIVMVSKLHRPNVEFFYSTLTVHIFCLFVCVNCEFQWECILFESFFIFSLYQDAAEVVNDLSGARSIDSVATKELIRAPLRSKSMLSALFVKNKYPKQKKASVL